MKKNIKFATVIAAILATVMVLASCSGLLDVVGNQSIASFEQVLAEIPAGDEGDYWCIDAPDGEAKFQWNSESARLIIDARPFVDAGLDENFQYIQGSKIIFRITLGSSGQKTDPLDDYRNIVRNYRRTISFHTEADHHAVDFGGGNAFEWANDMLNNAATNAPQAADIVFVLNPEPLIAAGVDPEAVEGWRFVTRQMGGEEVQKFVKPFNLREE